MVKHAAALALALSLMPLTNTIAVAGPISNACIQADRKSASRSLCNCIQSVANRALSRSEQRTAARFFKDPEKAQKMRRSDSSAHEKFWDRYAAFSKSATSQCS